MGNGRTDNTSTCLASNRIDVRDGTTIPTADEIDLSVVRVMVDASAAGLQRIVSINALPCFEEAVS